ncbi:MAG: nitrous oxide reductase accessory protein NosL, partial [Gammaproteobacteria bacterium]|nr:nitrous oxide reductase accessory protein NosL [Gammaproteobacteria bacterium]
DHKGPKGQVFLTDRPQPLWFTSVRDTIAFTMLPGEPKNIAAIYVTDIGHASWDQPEPGTWIEAREAFYVLGSDRVGGMQAAEVVPFISREDAKLFIKQHGGEIFVFESIPRESILESAEQALFQLPGVSSLGD